jgi:hypothetical protein
MTNVSLPYDNLLIYKQVLIEKAQIKKETFSSLFFVMLIPNHHLITYSDSLNPMLSIISFPGPSEK